MTESTYEFSYAMQRLRDAIDYAQTDGDFQQARIWSNHVEAAYNADIASEQELTRNANEGAKLLHSVAMNGEQSVLSRLDGKVDEVDAQRWQYKQIELAGRHDESGGESVDVSQYFNGYKATATKEWAKRHLNENVCKVCGKVSASLSTCTNCGVVE